MNIDATGLHYRRLNERIREAIADGAEQVGLSNVCGHRYIGCGISGQTRIDIDGTPGNDLAAFMDGPRIVVRGNAQDGVGNTMTGGEVVVHGHASDVVAHSLRGGRIFIRGSAGCRCAIHMKQYTEPVPSVVIGGCLGDYAGEYMAGGVLVVLGLGREEGEPLVGRLLGTGMHGGAIYLRGDVPDFQMGAEIGRIELEDADRARLESLVRDFAGHFDLDAGDILDAPFIKFYAKSVRPYGRLYVY
jgi:glutamate synthase domain-containing protein 3